MKQYSKEIYDIVIKPIEKYVYSENGLSTKSTDARNGLKPFPTTKTTVNTGHIESAVTLPHLQDKKYTTTTNIIICPDAALFTIPFAALITDNNNYLAEKYSISLIQSATAWMKTTERGKKRIHTNPFSQWEILFMEWDTATQKELPDNEDYPFRLRPRHGLFFSDSPELNSLALISLPTPLKTSLYKIIHFSVHGLFFSDSPELNSLALTSRDTASKYTEEELKAYEEKYGKLNRDGFLKMGDVAELDLKTDLLVMSACETSLGTVKAGGGYGRFAASVPHGWSE
jgi:CHAT domain-containing protein